MTNFCFAPTQWRALMMSIFFLGGASFSAFAATYFSDPSSATVVFTTNASVGIVTSSGWSIDSTGTTTPFGTVTIFTTDNIVIQAGSTVTTASNISQTIGNVTFSGGTFILAASTFNSQGNVIGTGVFNNASGNTSRITMIGTAKTLNVTLTGGGGFTIGSSSVTSNTIALAGNCSIGGRISVGGNASTTNTLDLAGFNVSLDNMLVQAASKLRASGKETINITGVTSGTVNSANGSTIYFDQTTPGTTNKVANLIINHAAAVKLMNEANADTVTLTRGNVVLVTANLTLGTIVGGSSSSYISTDNKLINGLANGSVICSVPAGVRAVLPMGTFTASYTGSIGNSYDPVALTPLNTATTFTVHVRNMFLDSAKLYDKSKVTKREWNISSSAPGATILELTPMYPSGTPTPVIGHYNSTTGIWEQHLATRTVNTWMDTVTTFSPFGVGTDSGFTTISLPRYYTTLGPLPISLKQFTATKKKAAVLLNWATENETNNASFLVQQSANGSSYKTIGQVKGNGNTAAKSAYSFEDLNPALGLNYYRLKQMDVDGRSTSSAVQLVRFSKATLALKATVVNTTLDVTVEDKTTTVSVYSMAGQKLLSASVKGTQQINVSHLQAGRYVLQTAEGESVNFIKQ